MTLLIVTATPVLLLVLLLMIGDPLSPFGAFIPLLAAFLMGYHFTAELEEAADILPECHWYRRRSRSVLTGNFVTLLLPVLSIPIVFCCVSFATLCSGYGIVRLLNFGIAFVSTVAIGVFRLTNRARKDQDVAMDLMLFALIAVGLFVPWVGGVFAVAALLVMVLVNWSVVGRD